MLDGGVFGNLFFHDIRDTARLSIVQRGLKRLAKCNVFLRGGSNCVVQKTMQNNHPVKTRRTVEFRVEFVELGQMFHERRAQVSELADHLGNVVVLFPADLSVPGCPPHGLVLDVPPERFRQRLGEAVQYFGKVINQLLRVEPLHGFELLVVSNGVRPLGDNHLATIRQEGGKLVADIEVD